MRNHKFIKATVDDAVIVNELRDIDILEIRASGASGNLEDIVRGFILNGGDVWIVWHNNKRQAICGITNDRFIWGLTTKDFIINHRKEFHKASLRFINHSLKRSSFVTNLIWSKNTLHINWLKKLGFKIGTKLFKNNISQEEFFVFTKER